MSKSKRKLYLYYKRFLRILKNIHEVWIKKLDIRNYLFACNSVPLFQTTLKFMNIIQFAKMH